MLYDIAIIGGGASGMMASISASLANDLKVAIKLYPVVCKNFAQSEAKVKLLFFFSFS